MDDFSVRKIISSAGNRIQDDRVGSLDTKPTAASRLRTTNVKGRSALHTIEVFGTIILKCFVGTRVGGCGQESSESE
jgi:hypothetical protein